MASAELWLEYDSSLNRLSDAEGAAPIQHFEGSIQVFQESYETSALNHKIRAMVGPFTTL